MSSRVERFKLRSDSSLGHGLCDRECLIDMNAASTRVFWQFCSTEPTADKVISQFVDTIMLVRLEASGSAVVKELPMTPAPFILR